MSVPDHCYSHCTGFRYKNASGTRSLSSRTRLCQHLSRHTSANCCSVKRRPGHYGPLMLCGYSFPGRVPRQPSEHSASPLQMSGTRCQLTFGTRIVSLLFEANSRHTFLPHLIHDETYPPQHLCILSLGGLYGALQI